MMESKQIHSYQGNAGPRPYWSLEDEKSLGLGSGNQFVNAGSVQIPEMSMVNLLLYLDLVRFSKFCYEVSKLLNGWTFTV